MTYMVRDFCEHCQSFYSEQAFKHQDDYDKFDYFWERSSYYAEGAKWGRPFGYWL